MGLSIADPQRALHELVHITPESSTGEDIAVFHLVAAHGLPGAEELHITRCLGALNLWAKRIGQATERRIGEFRRNPEDFLSSEGYFRMLVMTSVLQEELRVRYAEGRREGWEDDATYWVNCEELLVHGLLGAKRTGACSSLPVLQVALGRRLGYPLYLVSAPCHCFARWDDGQTRFNIECHGRGLTCLSDEEYHHWPVEWPEELHLKERSLGRERCCFLRNHTPLEEAALALGIRGRCLESNLRWEEALEAYGAAVRMNPQDGYTVVRAGRLGDRLAVAQRCVRNIEGLPGYDSRCVVEMRFEVEGNEYREAEVCMRAKVTNMPWPRAEIADGLSEPMRSIRRELQKIEERMHRELSRGLLANVARANDRTMDLQKGVPA